MSKSSKRNPGNRRQRDGAEKFLEDLIMYEYSPTCGGTDEDIDRVLRRDRRVRRKALMEAIDTLAALIRSNGPFDFERNIGINRAIDALRELRGRVTP